MLEFLGLPHDLVVGLLSALAGVLATWIMSRLFLPVFYFFTGWFFKRLAMIQIRYHVHRSSILPMHSYNPANSFWDRLSRFSRGTRTIQDTTIARESPLTILMQSYLGGIRPYELKANKFTGRSSYVLYVPSDWGKTKACEYFMREKIAKGIMFCRRAGQTYETSIRRAFGWFCRFLSQEDFRYAFITALTDEAAALPNLVIQNHVVILFDEWNGEKGNDPVYTIEDMNFADYVMRAVVNTKVIPVFLSHDESFANELCNLNLGTKIRPFPNCVDPTCPWEVGNGKDEATKYLKDSTIRWMTPKWTTEDFLNIAAGQDVVLGTSTLCFGGTKLVPLEPPEDLGLLYGLSPQAAMEQCRFATIAKATQQAEGGRRQRLLDMELPAPAPARSSFQPPTQHATA